MCLLSFQLLRKWSSKIQSYKKKADSAKKNRKLLNFSVDAIMEGTPFNVVFWKVGKFVLLEWLYIQESLSKEKIKCTH